MAEQQATTSGIDALIARLRDEGAGEGRAQAERILADAQQRAHRITDKAEAEARSLVDTAKREADGLRRAADDALRVAARDTVLDLKAQLERRFRDQIAQAVSAAMADESMLHQMIIEVAGRSRAESGIDRSSQVAVVLPRNAVGLDELRRKPEELREGSLAHFAAAAAGQMLRDGVSFQRAEGDAGGIRVKLADRGVELDLSDRAVADALLVHLQPRFRALLDGVAK